MIENETLIGSGSDNDIDWIVEFQIIDLISEQITDFESVEETILYSEIVKNLDPSFTKFFQSTSDYRTDQIEDVLYLLENWISIQTEMHDPDQPNASLWQKVYIQDENRIEFKNFLEAIFQVIQKLKIEKKIDHKLNNLLLLLKEKELNKKEREKEKQILENEKSRKLIEEKNIEEIKGLLSEIRNFMEFKSEKIQAIGNFLINSKSQLIVYLKKHESYRQTPSPVDEKVSKELSKDYKIIVATEKIPDGHGYIPYFAGQLRKKVRGWHQEVSELITTNPQNLNLVKEMRREFNRNLNRTKK